MRADIPDYLNSPADVKLWWTMPILLPVAGIVYGCLLQVVT